jgi:hypothetical protein
MALTAEWFLIVTLGSCCGILLAMIVQEGFKYVRTRARGIDIERLKRKLKPRRPTEEQKQLARELDILLKRKPAKAKTSGAAAYFSNLLKKQNPEAEDLVIRQVVKDALEK